MVGGTHPRLECQTEQLEWSWGRIDLDEFFSQKRHVDNLNVAGTFSAMSATIDGDNAGDQ